MLSKCKGQFLRVTGCLHALFAIDDDAWQLPSADQPLQEITSVVSDAAVMAAINFVRTCMNHTMYLCGRNSVNEEVKHIKMDLEVNVAGYEAGVNAAKNPEGYVLLLPGTTLFITALNEKKKFRDMGNKQGAVAAINNLERDDLGMVVSNTAQGTAKVCIQTQAACYH